MYVFSTKMATTVCFGPPPLPPNKKSLLTTSSHLRQRRHHQLPPFSPPLSLSSTYMSFRDPSDDEDPLQLEEKPFTSSSKQTAPIMRTASVNTNSLRRSVRNYNYSFNSNNHLDAPKLTLMRSQSEGNLAAVSGKLSTFDKCIKVLSGSWKNLLQRKLNTNIFFNN